MTSNVPAGLHFTVAQRIGGAPSNFAPIRSTAFVGCATDWNQRWDTPTTFCLMRAAADELLGHLRPTWQCRQTYWNAREQSRSHQDVLCLTYDGFDKSKPVFPRWAHGRQPKLPVFERVNRTHVAVSAILAHGFGCLIYLSEEGNTAGGEFSWECIMHCIQCCRDEDAKAGRAHAGSLWIQHDNTVKELKNQLTGVMLSSLVQQNLYEEAGSYMLPVGHTHEDVGNFGAIQGHQLLSFETFVFKKKLRQG